MNAGEVDVWRELRALHGETLFFGAPVASSSRASGAPSVRTHERAGSRWAICRSRGRADRPHGCSGAPGARLWSGAFPEFVNLLWKRVRRRECSRAAAGEILALWDVDCPRLVASSELAVRAFDLANELDHPVTDCLYLALAIGLDASLATADRRLARAARSRLEQVELIA